MKKHTFTENELEVLKQVQNGSLSKTMAGRKLGKDEKTIRRWLKRLADSASSASKSDSSSAKPFVAERKVEAKKRLEEDTYNCFYNKQWRFVHPDTLKKTGCKTARDYCVMEEMHNLWWVMARVPDGIKPDQYYKDKFDERCIQNGGTGFYKNI